MTGDTAPHAEDSLAAAALRSSVRAYANPDDLDSDSIEVGLFSAWLSGTSALGIYPPKPGRPLAPVLDVSDDPVKLALLLFIRAYANVAGLDEEGCEIALFHASIAGAEALGLPAPRQSPLRRAR